MAAGVYLHIPFCRSRCSYCDFATDIWRSDQAVERYVRALCLEIDGLSISRRNVDSIYFGGGTPSLLEPDQLDKILDALDSRFDVDPEAEITIEMNPATVTSQKLAAFRSSGANRASFGVQTFDDRSLRLLARGHDSNDARQTFRLLRDTGFENVSLDLIAGLPGQTIDQWKYNLEQAIALDPEHVSLYLLEIHEGTPLAEQVRSGRHPRPNDETGAEMYEVMLDRLPHAGYLQYEISNFSKAGYESRHNSKYWRLDPVFGFGVSAHSFNGLERYANDRDTQSYVCRIEGGDSPEIYRETTYLASEFIFLGLRLNAGIYLGEYEKRFGVPLADVHGKELARLLEAELIEISSNRLRLSRKGMLFSNEVFAAFV